MSLAISTEPIPLVTDEAGVVRICGTRVSLDSLIYAFREGATPEEIVQQYPTLGLADVYSVVTYYLRNQSVVDAYLEARREQRAELRQEVEARFDPRGLRDRLLARRRQPAA